MLRLLIILILFLPIYIIYKLLKTVFEKFILDKDNGNIKKDIDKDM